MRRLAHPLIVLLLFAAPAAAQNADQLYLVAFEAPVGSISSPGQGQTAVYVRWDTLEGELPGDLVEFELFRDATSLGLFAANGSLSDPEIAALYAGPENQRRLFEMVRWLDEEDPQVSVQAANLPQVLRQRVLQVPPRAALASRVDFNIARARLRGYLDTALASGTYTYQLRGHFSGAQDVLLGQASVTVVGTPDVAPAAEGLAQVSMYRCDAPERSKGNGTVALDWKTAGASIADEFANAIAIAGYDLYRSSENVGSAPPRDLRAEAAVAMHDAGGQVSLAGLEKVNDQPILIGGKAQKEALYQGFNPDFSQFFETQDELAAAGVQPGDTRAYYLVARDLSGNYGATTELLVTVTDSEAPAQPWHLRGYPRQFEGQYALEWPQVEARSYYRRNVAGRTYCNLDTARLDGFLEFVPEGQNCEDALHLHVDTAVHDYAVYRFDNAEQARRFTDSDGDGFDDADERPSIEDPGTACDPTLPDPQTSPLTNYRVGLVPAANATPAADGQAFLEFIDPVPAQNVGEGYWYRIASRDLAGNSSGLSEVLPALVPDRTLPDRDDELGGLTFGRRICAHGVNPRSVPADDVAFDLTSPGVAHTLRISCPNSGSSQAPPTLFLPFEERISGERTARLSSADCQDLGDPESGCEGRPTDFDYLGRTGSLLATYSLSSFPDQCPITGSELFEECDRPIIVPIDDGEVIPPEEGPWLDPAPGPNCIGVFRRVDGRALRLTTMCPGDPPPQLANLPDLGGDLICLSLASYNQNARSSPMLNLPCFRRPGTPTPPTPVAIEFQTGQSQATVSLLQAERPTIGALIEWEKTGDPQSRRVAFVPRAAGPDTDTADQIPVEITPEPPGPSWQEEWCFRGISIGGLLLGDPNSGFSEWSETVCGDRQPAGAPAVESLGWPQIPIPPEDAPLAARFLAPDDIPMVLLSDDLAPTGCVPTGLASCDPGSATPGATCVGEPGDPSWQPVSAQCDMCSAIYSKLTVPVSFVAYRQSRLDALSVPSDYVQVSPLVEPFCWLLDDPDPVSFLEDPFVSLLNLVGGDPWPGFRLVFTDRSPYRNGQQLRYHFVFFVDGEIVGSRTSNWVTP